MSGNNEPNKAAASAGGRWTPSSSTSGASTSRYPAIYWMGKKIPCWELIVLGKLVSEKWNDDLREPIFIDRNGNIFEQVLQYIRYGSIELPITLLLITRSMFDRELDYYGIIPVRGTINNGEPLFKVMDSFVLSLADAERKHDAFMLAHACYREFIQKRLEHPGADAISIFIGGGKARNQNIASTKEGRKLFDFYLEKYFGLFVPADETVKIRDRFPVHVKKRTPSNFVFHLRSDLDT